MCDFTVVSLQQWCNKSLSKENDTVDRLPIVDIREWNDTKCLGGSSIVVVRLPFSTLLSGERSCELPPRHFPFAVLTSEDTLESARAFFGATSSKATQQSRKPWRVPHVLLANDQLWLEAKGLGILKNGEEDTMYKGNGSSEVQPRLWQPDPMIEHVLWPLLRADYANSLSSSCRSHSQQVWDLGSGAGRDVCFLAEQAKYTKMDHYVFVGIDNHKGSTKRCLPFWKHRLVEDYTQARNINLNKVDLVQDEMKGQDIVCLYAVRFWNAKLVKFIATTADIRSGTLFCMSHFCKPSAGAPWDFDHPKEKSVLERSELRTLFQETKQWEILHDEIAQDGDHGRTLIHFVARKL